MKIENDLHDYLSCELLFSKHRKTAWLGQPHLVSNLIKNFEDEVKGLRSYVTPGTPGLNQIREEDPALKLSAEKHAKYRSGVGMLLYLVKHSRPDIANCVRELSKVLDGPSEASYKEMLRCIKYVLDSKDMGLKIEPIGDKDDAWEIICYSDSDWAGDPESRRSVSGYIIYVQGVPVIWKSKSQNQVSLSSSESEWYALSEAVKDIIFLLDLCDNLGKEVSLPVTMYVDNIGAIFMSNNVSTSSRTKHIRTKYVRDFVEDGVVSIEFVPTGNNHSDILTKNVTAALQEKHSEKLIWEKQL